jgi:hypothetical protein
VDGGGGSGEGWRLEIYKVGGAEVDAEVGAATDISISD